MTTVFDRHGAVARRAFLRTSAAALSAGALPLTGWAQSATPSSPAAHRTFAPQPGAWRTFEVTTRVDIAKPQGATKVWLPIPSVNSDWQRSLESSYSSNGQTRLAVDGRCGARILAVEFDANEPRPFVELTSRVQTQSRAKNLQGKGSVALADASDLRFWRQASDLLPLDGIVHDTAMEITQGAKTDVEKAQAIFHWVVTNTYREPKVRGCGIGDIKAMLETNNLGGKCADLNALFVGLCRAAGLPARDVYGLRLAPSAFGYRELGGNPASLKGAQHCRAEVYLRGFGWVAMDPADVGKAMRLESAEWIKSTEHPLIAPVNQALFGGWEGNWMAYNTAFDVSLPGAKGGALAFFMYPVAENAAGRLDSYAPDDFKYQISAREVV